MEKNIHLILVIMVIIGAFIAPGVLGEEEEPEVEEPEVEEPEVEEPEGIGSVIGCSPPGEEIELDGITLPPCGPPVEAVPEGNIYTILTLVGAGLYSLWRKRGV